MIADGQSGNIPSDIFPVRYNCSLIYDVINPWRVHKYLYVFARIMV